MRRMVAVQAHRVEIQMSPETLLARWRQAHRRATELERKLFQATILYTRGEGPNPAKEEWEQAQQLRKEASELFKRAMESSTTPQPQCASA
jgi:hypothetical protein